MDLIDNTTSMVREALMKDARNMSTLRILVNKTEVCIVSLLLSVFRQLHQICDQIFEIAHALHDLFISLGFSE